MVSSVDGKRARRKDVRCQVDDKTVQELTEVINGPIASPQFVICRHTRSHEGQAMGAAQEWKSRTIGGDWEVPTK